MQVLIRNYFFNNVESVLRQCQLIKKIKGKTCFHKEELSELQGHKPYLDSSLCSLIRQGALVVTRNIVQSLKFSNPFIAVPNAGASPPQVPERLSTKRSSPPDYANTPPPTQQNSSLEPARFSPATTTKQLCSSYSWFAPAQ